MTESSKDSTGGYTAVPSFAELAKINVNQYTEKKGELTYISWVRQVEQLLQHDADATWEYSYFGPPDHPLPYLSIPSSGTTSTDYTAMVICTVKAFGRERTAQLPVLDFKNRAIVNPTAMEINTTMQRCLAKGIALHGIGLYVYAGEDLPTEIADDVRETRAELDRVKSPEKLKELEPRIAALVEEHPELRGFFAEAYSDKKTALSKKGVVGLKDKLKPKEDRPSG